MFVHMYVQA